ncbi:MAG: pro-sigmaK processing inhibitor BofA family protein [Bacilli bacterium]|nr:pro-sigmaK processing inhibitor BofA family protein [Bacilli bacterium]MDD4547274.1 pro-sigmaK processing inhibitor BofA family protein [Bacilli bacterium]
MRRIIMLKKIFSVLKKVIYSSFLIYGYNMVAAPLNLIIPLNLITVGLVMLLGFPSLISLIIILSLVF